jgi:hypothetical protein
MPLRRKESRPFSVTLDGPLSVLRGRNCCFLKAFRYQVGLPGRCFAAVTAGFSNQQSAISNQQSAICGPRRSTVDARLPRLVLRQSLAASFVVKSPPGEILFLARKGVLDSRCEHCTIQNFQQSLLAEICRLCQGIDFWTEPTCCY